MLKNWRVFDQKFLSMKENFGLEKVDDGPMSTVPNQSEYFNYCALLMFNIGVWDKLAPD